MEDISIVPMAINLVEPEEGEEGQGVQLAVLVGVPLPFENPQQPGSPLQVPVKQIRINLGAHREFGVQVGQAIIDACEKLPETPGRTDLVTATSMADVNKVAEAARRFGG